MPEKSRPTSYLIPNSLADSAYSRYTSGRPPQSSKQEMLRLGPAQLHHANQSLTIGSRTVALQRKPFLVLQYLVENRDRMVQRKELLDRFWDGHEVYDESLSKAIGTIRKAFGDAPDGHAFIETRWGLGYRYVGPFDESPSQKPSDSLDQLLHAASFIANVVEAPTVPTTVMEPTVTTGFPAATGVLPPQATTLRLTRWRARGWYVAALLVPIAVVSAVWLAHGRTASKSAAAPAAQTLPVKSSSDPDTSHPQAYAKYMKARFFANSRTQSSLTKAIDLLNEVLLIDPKYARAYAALADCYQLQGFYHFATPSEAYPRARAAALKALVMDDSLVEAHISLLAVLSDYDWDWEGAEREFKASIAIDPNYAAAYQYYGYALLGMGRGEEAVTAMKHAAELDPVSPSIQTSLAWGYYLQRQFEPAIEQCKRVLELYPDFVPAHQLLGILYGQLKSRERSFAELNRAESLEKDSEITPILLDAELALSGKQAEAAQGLQVLIAKSATASVPDYYLAAAWLAAGDKGKAQTYLERAFRFHSNWIIYLQYDPRFDSLRADPHFEALLRRIASARTVAATAGRHPRETQA
jgi:DNA-binding winged helix-turn-helix (wHTH) protein/Tfp pilus assembly protein PilF